MAHCSMAMTWKVVEMSRKVCVVITARPSYSRIKSTLVAMREHPEIEMQLVVSGSALLHNYGSVVDRIVGDGFDINHQFSMVLEPEDMTAMAKTTGLGLIELATALDNLEPDVVVTIADRYETIATAIAASYMNTPVAHVQGGEVTGSIDDRVRHAVTKLSDLHFVSTQKSAERVIRMGEDESRVFVTGCPSIDIAAEILAHPELDFDPFEKYGGVGSVVDLDDGYLVVLQHPVTSEYTEGRAQIEETLVAIRDLGLPTLWFWPNVDSGSSRTSRGIRAFREHECTENIRFFTNMTSTDFLRLVYNSEGIVGNSSVAIRECGFLGVPAVNIGGRQTGREQGHNVIDVDYSSGEIRAAVDSHLKNGKPHRSTIYGSGQAGVRICELLAREPLAIDKRLTY